MFPTFLSASFLWSSLTFISKSTAWNCTVGSPEPSPFFLGFSWSARASLRVHVCDFYVLLLTPDHAYPFLWVLPACAERVGDAAPHLAP